jgi:hypothetical protein
MSGLVLLNVTKLIDQLSLCSPSNTAVACSLPPSNSKNKYVTQQKKSKKVKKKKKIQ